MENIPLVSCTVVTYNSSKYVLETLESIFNQTYPRLELIVSDDCSTDNTVQLCKEWIEGHKERFERTLVLEIDHNTGVSANLNRADAACQGEWCKGIAGDDLLLPNCVQDCMDYVTSHPDDDIVCLFGGMEGFGERVTIDEQYKNINSFFFDLTAKGQYLTLVNQGNMVFAPTCFHNLKKYREYNIHNDNRISNLEDWPKWINITKQGHKMYGCDKTLVKYRIHGDSLSTDTSSPRLRTAIAKVWLLYCFKEQKRTEYRASVIGYLYIKKFLSNNIIWKVLLMLTHLLDTIFCILTKKDRITSDRLNNIVKSVLQS